MSTMVAILYFLTIWALEKIGSSTIWRASFRGLLADYAYVVGITKDLDSTGTQID